jgi:hypothetical protein
VLPTYYRSHGRGRILHGSIVGRNLGLEDWDRHFRYDDCHADPAVFQFFYCLERCFRRTVAAMSEETSSMVQSMGAISALRTGNVIFDMMIAMLIPLFFNFFIGFIQSCLAKIRTGDLSWNVMFGRMYERTIDHKMTQNLYGDSSNADRDTRNNV